MLFSGEEARTVHDIGFPLDERLEQHGIICRVVFEVCVLYEHVIAGCVLEAKTQRRAFAAIARLQEHEHVLVASLQCFKRLTRPVG